MSHQTGIQANPELRNFFGKCKDGKVRVFKVIITNEELALEKHLNAKGTWEEDYDKMVLPLIEDNQPCYIFFRLDTPNQNGYDWIFISWSPDDSPVRQKMLYASTKATLKKEFGGGNITYELFGNIKEDVSLRGYRKFLTSEKAPAPLTLAEEELSSIRKNEARTDTGVDAKHQTLRGLHFPMSDDVVGALFDLKEGQLSYVQLSIDTEKEEINLESRDNISVNSLRHKIPKNSPRYHLFLFPHSHEGDHLKSIVFIYSIPGYQCPVKERMLYSSCKSPLVETIETKVEMEIAKKIEIDDPNELNEAFLLDQLHPKQNICKQMFAKPKGPANRGARRLIKTQRPEDNE
ncbi:twinfilin-1-like [Ornithodoros turicata]|uniref:Twinfilin n=1 Tax=Ornithodoros turicata TaxID=34597 RepID=A0A2R5LGT2_9ACAR